MLWAFGKVCGHLLYYSRSGRYVLQELSSNPDVMCKERPFVLILAWHLFLCIRVWPGQKRRFLRYNSEKCQSKTIFFKLYRIGPLPLGVIVPNLRKNLSTLIAKIVISQ
jgi:hypothetical protein